jgi:integral membrane sensor domain MASE1
LSVAQLPAPVTFAKRTDVSSLLRTLLFGGAYLGSAELGHVLSFADDGQTFLPLAPPAGLFLAALVLSRFGLWWLLIAAACVATVISYWLLHGQSLLVTLGFCAANAVEACLGAWLLRQIVGLPFALDRPRDVVFLVCFGPLCGAVAGAAVGAAVIVGRVGDAAYWSAFHSWWSSHSVGIIIVAPVILTWANGTLRSIQEMGPARIAEAGALGVGILAASEFVYGDWLPRPLQIPALMPPFLIWAALRFGPRAAASALFGMTVIAVWNAAQGRGPEPLPSVSAAERVVRVQGILSIFSLCVYLLAATVAERRRAERERIALLAELQTMLAEIRTLRGLIPICAWCKKIRDDQDFWHSVEDYVTSHTEARFSHGVCPECFERELRSAEQAQPKSS